jgi:hypothetical protein
VAEWLVPGLIAAASFLVGWLLIWQFGPPRSLIPGSWLPILFAGLVMGVMVLGWLGFVLAEIGYFSAGRLAVIWLLLCSALGLLAWHRRPEPAAILATDEPINHRRLLPVWVEYLFLTAWLVAALWLFFRPHEFIIGGADAGVYVNLGASITRQEGILIQDEILADLDPALYPALLRPIPSAQSTSQAAGYYLLPGFYVPGSPAGQVTPQFYHLHPVWQAVAYDLGQPLNAALEAALLLTGLWAMLGSLAVYLTVRQLAGWETAALALTALTLSGLQLWFARYPTTEMLTQLLIWTGLWAMIVWLGSAGGWSRQPPEPARVRFWGLLAGMGLGQVFLVRVDTYLLLIVPAGLWLILRWSGRWRGHHWWFFVPLAGLTLHSLVHAYWQSRPYLYSIFGVALRLGGQSWLPLLAGGAGLLLLIAAGYLVTADRHLLARLNHLNRPAAVAASGAIIGLALYGWFIRPHLGGVEGVYSDWFGGGAIPRLLDRENLVRLGWYLSPLGIALATAGTCLLIWYADRQTVPLLLVGLVFSLLYLWRVQANPHHVYVMRRYVPVVVPYAMVAGAYGLRRLAWHKSDWSRVGAVILAVIWLAGLGLLARGFVSQVDYRGIIGQMESLNRQLDPHSVLIFDDQAAVSLGDFVGTPLQYVYDHRVFSLRDPDALDTHLLQETIRAWQQAGRTVYWVGEPARLTELALSAGQPFSATISVEFLEGTYDRKPTQLLPLNWTLTVTPIQGSGK